jgi:hypothetical protein
MKKTIIRLNKEYNEVLRDAKKRLERQRVDLNGRRGYVQAAHVNADGVRVDIILDDGNLAKDVDALTPCYDP